MSQSTLKRIALISMLLDHTAKVLLVTGILTPVLGMEADLMLRTWMKVLGRIAFPIFAWCAAEGSRHTSDPVRHLLRLLAFAVLSEIPFQLCFSEAVHLGCHNVIFTMLLAAAAIHLSGWLSPGGPPWAPLLPAVLAVCLGWLLHTDYNAWGVVLILALYYLPSDRGRLLFLGAWITVFQLIWHGWDGQSLIWLRPNGQLQLLYWLGQMVSVGLLATYRGERGRGSKWLFYCFYPCHLLILYGLSVLARS